MWGELVDPEVAKEISDDFFRMAIAKGKTNRKCVICGIPLSLHNSNQNTCFQHTERTEPVILIDEETLLEPQTRRKNHFVKSNGKKTNLQSCKQETLAMTGLEEIDNLIKTTAERFGLENPSLILAGYRGDRETAKKVANTKGVIVSDLISKGYSIKKVMGLLNIKSQGNLNNLINRPEIKTEIA